MTSELTTSALWLAGSWTITDCELSPDNQWMIYSSITPRAGMVKMGQPGEMDGGEDQEVLDFARGGAVSAAAAYRRFGVSQIRRVPSSKICS